MKPKKFSAEEPPGSPTEPTNTIDHAASLVRAAADRPSYQLTLIALSAIALAALAILLMYWLASGSRGTP